MYLLSTDRHHVKTLMKQSTVPVIQGAPVVSAFSGISLASGSQSGVGGQTGARGIILANIPQISSLDSLKNSSIRVSKIVVPYNYNFIRFQMQYSF